MEGGSIVSLDFSDWSFGGNAEREEEVINFLQELFTDFWLDKHLENLSDSKQELYCRNLNWLGEILVMHAVADPRSPEAQMTPHELFMANVNETEGPLLDPDDDVAQNVFDIVCGKLYRYLCEREQEQNI